VAAVAAVGHVTIGLQCCAKCTLVCRLIGVMSGGTVCECPATSSLYGMLVWM
jgi:hypothetical protein